VRRAPSRRAVLVAGADTDHGSDPRIRYVVADDLLFTTEGDTDHAFQPP